MRELFRKIIMPPAGPVLSIGLVGLMILGGFLYYKAVRFQRFLEPALAMTQPGSEFDQRVRSLLKQEFGPEDLNTVRYVRGTIYVHESLFQRQDRVNEMPSVYGKLGRFFMAMLDEPEARSDVKVILVSTMARVSKDPLLGKYNRVVRHEMQDIAEEILNAIYAAEPGLEAKYGMYFEPTAVPVMSQETDTGWVAFRIIPSELLHIEVLQRLEKYMD